MGVSKPVSTYIKKKVVNNVEIWVNKESDMPYSKGKHDLKGYYFHFWFASNSNT